MLYDAHEDRIVLVDFDSIASRNVPATYILGGTEIYTGPVLHRMRCQSLMDDPDVRRSKEVYLRTRREHQWDISANSASDALKVSYSE